MSIFTNPASSSKDEAAEYTSALLALLGNRDPISVMQRTDVALHNVVVGIVDQRLAMPEAPGKWSVRQVLAHFADSDLVLGWRLRMILTEDRPSIQGYDQDAWADRLGYQEVDAEFALEVFSSLRRWNLRVIARAAGNDLHRVGVHSERGDESVQHLIRLYAAHDLLHLNQIARILTVV